MALPRKRWWTIGATIVLGLTAAATGNVTGAVASLAKLVM